MTRISSLFQFGLLCLSTASYAAPASEDGPASTKRASNACGQIVNSGDLVFKASLVYECLTSVPFNAAVATRFIQYYNDTLQFHSTLAYLKNPPESYQQPAVDVIDGLGRIQTAISKGLFKNQYEFEATLESLIYSTHDMHLELVSGIMGVFSFGTQYAITSVSLDGLQLPKVYLSDDLLESQLTGATWKPSAISQINGQPVLDYLLDFASINAFGTLEFHSDFNQLMTSPAQDIQAVFNKWGGGAEFYPGDTLKFVLENGTTITTPWLAVYNSPGPTGPLETGGDFYNFFVLGFYPASFDPFAASKEKRAAGTTTSAAASSTSAHKSGTSASSATASSSVSQNSGTAVSSATATPSSWNNLAYPLVPDVAQPDLGTYGGGFISGYFIGNGTAVLSIPSFNELGEAVNTFSETVALFLRTCKEKEMKKIVIDVQQNTGGDALLAFDTFKHFFPTLDPFGGSRMRAHKAANVMGDAITQYWNELTEDDDDYYNLAADEWMSADRINANTNRNFTSWAEFYGPHRYNGDNFTTVQRYNLSSYIFDMESTQDFDEYFAVYGYGGNPANTTQPYPASSIIILSDGICSSTCAMFMEMMHHEAGVKTVVAGGYPINGPMQAPAGSRGARVYSVTDVLDSNIAYAQYILQDNNDPRQNFFPNRTEALDVYVEYAGINLRDQVRKGSDIPLQFLYEAANCRIFFTPKTFYNYSALWQYAADAIWTNPKLCVNGSTGYATTNGTATTAPTSAKVSPTSIRSAAIPSSSTGAIILAMLGASTSNFDTVPITDKVFSRNLHSFEGDDCTNKTCAEFYHCTSRYATKCANNKPVYYHGCAAEVYMYPGKCTNGGTPQALEPTHKGETKAELSNVLGYCVPPLPACALRKSTTQKVKPGKGAPASGSSKKKRN